MQGIRWIGLLAVAIALAAPAAPARAEEGTVSKGGPEVKYITNDRYEGLLYGARGVRFLTPNLYVGLMAFGTLPLIGKEVAPAFGYGGVLAGWEGKLPYGLGYDLDLHAGYTSDLVDGSPNPARNQISVEPSVALGVPVPVLKATRLSLCLGYLWLPFAPANSAVTIGLRWETKVISRPYEE